MSNTIVEPNVKNSPTVTPVEADEQLRPDFGNGRYSPLMSEAYDDAMTVFKLSSERAAKLARAIGADLGAFFANQPVEVKLGKMNKDGKLTIAEACKVKGITCTNAISALRALNYAADAGKHGFSHANTGWKVTAELKAVLERY